MPTDYDKIREDNLLEYGRGTRHLFLLSKLYTDRTHFVFELLQNAEDAGATRILFRLFEDRLEVTHNGRPFDERDVRGVCGVGEGTKTEDLTQIGEFGIGFKSVYAYTTTPEVHSGGEGFKIENYVRPYGVLSKLAGTSWTTLFTFPFNAEEIAPETARKEIGERLRTLSTRTLLFLRKINKIEFSLPDSTGGIYQRKEVARGSARQVSVIGQNNGKDEEESWLIFERPVSVPGKSATVRVEVSFRLEAEDKIRKNPERIIRVKDSPLVVYFPTEKATRFGFLIQGPYRTTPSRDNIPKDNEWNKTLVRETAELVGDILPEIKDFGLLSVSFLESLPIRTVDFPEGSMFYPIVESVRKALKEEDLLPTDHGAFVSARNAKLARGADLRELLSHDQLSQLFQSAVPIGWLAGEITQDRTPDLRSYLMNELKVEEVTPESFARKINLPFLPGQSDEWFVKFYGYLSDHEALWRAHAGILRNKPILRLENGNHVAPDGYPPKAYLPPHEETNFPIVNRFIAKDNQSRDFLKRLGLSEPDVFADIAERVLPKYTEVGGASISCQEHKDDIHKIIRAMGSDSAVGQTKVVWVAKQTPFLRAVNSSGDECFKKPVEIYLNTPELQRYFSNSRTAWFLHDDYSSEEVGIDIWRHLGVSDLPRILRSEGLPGSLVEKSTREETIKNFRLDGLKQFLRGIREVTDFEEQKRSAIVLLDFLHNHLRRAPYLFQAEYSYFFWKQKRKNYDSEILVWLKGSKWIPTKDGTVEKPSAITQDRLLDKFAREVELIEKLGIAEGPSRTRQSEKDIRLEHATELGVSLEDIEFLKSHRNEVEKWKAGLAAPRKPPTFPTEPVTNPERRQEHLVEQLSDAPDKEYKKRERSVRTTNGTIDPTTWLRSRYTNADDQMICQRCEEEMPFRKRDGKHYFEKKEVLSRKYLPKEHKAQYLALCPLCAAMYAEFVINDDDAMADLKNKLLSEEGCHLPVTLGEQETSIRFVEKHIHDLKLIIKEV